MSGRRRQLCKPSKDRVERFLQSPPPCVQSCALRAPLLGSRLQSSPWALLAAAPPALLTPPDTPRRRPRAGCLPPPPSATHAQLRPQGLPEGCSIAAGLWTLAHTAWFPNMRLLAMGALPSKRMPRGVSRPRQQLLLFRPVKAQSHTFKTPVRTRFLPGSGKGEPWKRQNASR